jgi:hypothetical protein
MNRNGVVAAALMLTLHSVAGVASAAPPAKPASSVATASSTLSAAEVKAQIVGYSVALADGGMTWFFNKNGSYDADDGRNGRAGTFTVQQDGKLCWNESTGIKGCFQYYRKGGKLLVRRADPGHSTELGAVALGPL